MDKPIAAVRRRTLELALPRGRAWRVGPRAAILGILNVTPDSFSDGGLHARPDDAVQRGLQMLSDGADALDIGGESTRPGAAAVPTEEQLRRVLPVLRELRQRTDAPLSVDTRDPRVGEAAIEAGADVINDVNALRNPGWLTVLRSIDVPVVLMHMRGTPEDMQEQTDYPDGVVSDIADFLRRRLAELAAAGIAEERCILDPGIGFAKRSSQNVEILRGLPALADLGRPLLIGVSRKAFLGKLLSRLGGEAGGHEPAARDVATAAANAFALMQGASIFRVHNVAVTRDLLDILEELRGHGDEIVENRS